MANCMIAQSGGPTCVTNAMVAGIVKANRMNPYYEHVYGAINGMEGVLQQRFTDLSEMSEEENRILRQTPSSALGSCRYKLKKENIEEIEKIIRTMETMDIETLFYIGGHEAMDAVRILSRYAKEKGIEGRRFIGCPKTVDNDVPGTDHCPGYGSAAKFIATASLQCWYDLHTYPSSRKEVVILETMGMDSGWLAASACLSGVVDILIVPEEAFDRERFLQRLRRIMMERSKCFIVVSEGARYEDGTLLSQKHTAEVLEQMILEEDPSVRCRVQDLSIAQRCHATEQSQTDAQESFYLGMSAHMQSINPVLTGKMIAIVRREGNVYEAEYTAENASAAKDVRLFPEEWLLSEYRGITEEAVEYLRPLIAGTAETVMKDGLPVYVTPYYMRTR